MLASPRLRSSTILYNEKGHPASSSGQGRRSGLQSRGTQLLALRFGWVVLVIWFEVGEFFSSLSSCKFPDSVLRRSTSAYSSTPPTHVVLLADPHVPHPRLSYPRGSRPWINMIRQAMEELFMRKSWNVVMRLGRIDAVVVVGDMLDWGRGVMSDAEYEDYYSLFHSIFQLPDNVPMYFVPGNHDLPLGPNRMFSPYARDRYTRYFSPPNALLPIANHTLVLLDSVGLVEEDYRRYAAEMQFGEWDGVEGGVIEFVRSVAEEPFDGPRILLSHIPLARPDLARCGPLREKGRIQKGAGPGYQNLLGSETTRFLLEELKPTVIFSGDDHDYCEYTHPSGIREVTIKSFSSSAGIRRPGFQLLSLIPSSDLHAEPRQISHADRPCFLPDQLGVYYTVYLPVAILTISYLFLTNLRSAFDRWLAASNKPTPPIQSEPARYDRPVPLTLPSRKSSGQLSSRRAVNHTLSPSYQSPHFSTHSAPVSPVLSPRASFSEERHYGNENESGAATPGTSRRSSYIYMNGSDLRPSSSPQVSAEPGSYFLQTPGVGLGLSTPMGAYPASPTPPRPRRVPMSRILSTSDWSAAARGKEKSVLGLIMDALPGQRWSSAFGALRGFFAWLWRTRNSVLVKSWREAVAIAWPAGVVWLLVNALFFLQ